MPHPLSLHLPDALYERIQDVAAYSDRPVEAVLVESLMLLFGPPPVDLDQLGTTMENLSDGRLWALVYRRLSWVERERLRDLSVQGKQAPLAPEEQVELDGLIDESDRVMLLRSHALLVLRQRGRHIGDHLHVGA